MIERCARTLAWAGRVGVLLITSMSLASTYDEQLAIAARTCESVAEDDYQTGLLSNPDGYRSYYVRSVCFQKLAIKFRKKSYCSLVKRRYALFSSSWGYSENNCEKLVSEGVRADTKTLEGVRSSYEKGPVELTDFRIERNGNGRDYDIIPVFSGGYDYSYTLRFHMIFVGDESDDTLLKSSGFRLRGSEDNIRMFVRQAEIRDRLPGFVPSGTYLVRATLTLSVGNGSYYGRWSDDFVEKIFPERDRSQYIEREVNF